MQTESWSPHILKMPRLKNTDLDCLHSQYTMYQARYPCTWAFNFFLSEELCNCLHYILLCYCSWFHFRLYFYIPKYYLLFLSEELCNCLHYILFYYFQLISFSAVFLSSHILPVQWDSLSVKFTFYLYHW